MTTTSTTSTSTITPAATAPADRPAIETAAPHSAAVQPSKADHGPTPAEPAVQRKVLGLLASRDFCTLATVSPAGHPHVAGIVYAHADGALWSSTMRSSRKARNIGANPRVGICVPFRRLPVGPPFTIHFQADAELLDPHDPALRRLVDSGALKAITSHGELDLPDGCFVRIRPKGTIHSFGPGASLIDLVRDPIGSGARSFAFDDADRAGGH